MATQPATITDKTTQAHAAADADDIARLRSLSEAERSRMIELACEAAAAIHRDRLAAGLGEAEPAPWPASTWEFLRKHAARVRSEAPG
jgi:hypothetical protein